MTKIISLFILIFTIACNDLLPENKKKVNQGDFYGLDPDFENYAGEEHCKCDILGTGSNEPVYTYRTIYGRGMYGGILKTKKNRCFDGCQELIDSSNREARNSWYSDDVMSDVLSAIADKVGVEKMMTKCFKMKLRSSFVNKKGKEKKSKSINISLQPLLRNGCDTLDKGLITSRDTANRFDWSFGQWSEEKGVCFYDLPVYDAPLKFEEANVYYKVLNPFTELYDSGSLYDPLFMMSRLPFSSAGQYFEMLKDNTDDKGWVLKGDVMRLKFAPENDKDLFHSILNREHRKYESSYPDKIGESADLSCESI